MLTVSKEWEVFQEEVAKCYQIDTRILDYIAVYEILEAHLNGMSLAALLLKFPYLDALYIESILKEFLNTFARRYSLPIKLYLVFKNPIVSRKLYLQIVRKYTEEDEVEYFSSCLVLLDMEEKISDYYSKEGE